MKRIRQDDNFERALKGELSKEELYSSSAAVVDAALWSDWSNENSGSRSGDQFWIEGSSENTGPSYTSELRAFTSELRVSPERRSQLIQSLIQHPERARRMFRS